MANFLGVNIETPQETQKRILAEQREGLKSTKSVEERLGFNFGMGIASLVGAFDKSDDKRVNAMDQAGQEVNFASQEIERVAAEQQKMIRTTMSQQGATEDQITSAIDQHQAGLSAQKEKTIIEATSGALAGQRDRIMKEGTTDPIEAEMMSRALGASRLRALGGAENKRIASQLTAMNTQVMVEQQQRQLETDKTKAQIKQAEAATSVSERALLETKTIDELSTEAELLEARIPTLKDETAAKNANERLTSLRGLVEEKKIEGYIPASGVSAETFGIAQEELDALTTPWGIPRDTLNTLIQQRRVELEDERLEFARTKLPTGMQAKQTEAINNVFGHSATRDEAYGLAQDVLTIARTEGFGGDIRAEMAKQFGIDDPALYLKTRLNRLITGNALSRRPPGAMTEKEWDFLFKGEIPENADSNQIAQYLTRIAQLEAFSAEYERARSNWLDDNRDFRGFEKSWSLGAGDMWSAIEGQYPTPIARPRTDVNTPDIADPINDPLVQQYLNPQGTANPSVRDPATTLNPNLPGTL